ncbi:OLC1v1004750C1 [Oldenlandia corymbosa var. corymbosa]|uniref:OLC1v1004750C1 n=1 Tax=Oldenlandia corymbosa var. corymbosa TaxID=529605 RepID=A0AAV1DCZ9_OLDCO|nr:OLC1v1004750C1 [Oldenlandia corymbosa var. corymbosa]
MAKSRVEGFSSIDEDLIWEILIFLPVKSLMRFKCVCKLWLSMIQNPFFVRAYRGGFKGLLLSNLSHILSSSNDTSIEFFYLNYLEGDVPTNIIHHYSIPTEGKIKPTKLVNGLICLYSGENSWMYNVATREKMSLPDSGYDYEEVYHLGFDPSNRVYKLLKTGFCRILTIGVDSSWRSIIDLAPMVASDLRLLLFGPNVELAKWECLPDSGQVRMQFFNHHIGNGKPAGKVSLSGGTWREHEVNPPIEEGPREMAEFFNLNPLGILPDGKVTFLDDIAHFWQFPVPFYLYDKTKRELQKRFISDCPSSPIAQKRIVEVTEDVVLWYYEENILPLSCLGPC